MARHPRKKIPTGLHRATVHALSHDGRGIATIEGKTTFLLHALPGEEVEFEYTFSKSQFDEGRVTQVLKASEDRVTPPCRYADVCGGCSLQHLSSDAQVKHKTDVLVNHLAHFGRLDNVPLQKPILGDTLGYRTKARLGVRHVLKKGGTLIGFREKSSNYLTDMDECAIMDPRVGEKIKLIRQLIDTLSIPEHIPQIEVSMGDKQAALIFRHMKPFPIKDIECLRAFGKTHDFTIYLQPAGPDSIHAIFPEHPPRLSYELPKYNLTLEFEPTDFTQVNMSINRQLIDRVIELLAIEATDIILDLFCGLGNFTLPLATKAAQVIGVEGSTAMVKRAMENAKTNELKNITCYAADLTQNLENQPWQDIPFNKLLLDPPRSGALEIVQSLERFPNIERIVYVACNPATLARDIGVLVNQHGFHCEQAGILDMFPHTSHVESIALLTR